MKTTQFNLKCVSFAIGRLDKYEEQKERGETWGVLRATPCEGVGMISLEGDSFEVLVGRAAGLFKQTRNDRSTVNCLYYRGTLSHK